MKATELRIGNWVQTKQTEKQFQVTTSTFEVLSVVESQYKPIPLTEEWLVKFGFDKLHGNWFDNEGMIELYEKDNGYVMLEDSYYHCSQDLLYVHQLQNLYFALTGEELELKP